MSTTNLAYDVFVNDPPPQDGVLPNGEPKRFSPMASTLICGNEDAVLTDPGMTEDQARVLGDWVAAKDRNVTISSSPTATVTIFSRPGYWPNGSGRVSSPPTARSRRCTAAWRRARCC